MNAIIGLLVRHLINSLGASAIVTSEMEGKIVGALAILGTIIWSAWQKKRSGAMEPKPTDQAAASVASKIIPPLVLVLLLGAGCASILPGNDPVIVRAQQTREIAFSTFDTFVTLEYRNRAFLQKLNPNFTDVADNIRTGAPKWFKSFDQVLVAYKAGKTPATKSKLDGAIAVIESALTEAQTYIALAAEKGVTP